MSALPDAMQAYRIHRFGGPDVLQRDSIPVPEPAHDELLIRVRAASVNPVDYKTREGQYPLVRADALPFTPGRDASGVIERVGSDVNGWKPGQHVYAFIGQGQGTYAQFVTVKAAAVIVPDVVR